MTDAQIEAVARLYCRKLGMDPDAPHHTSPHEARGYQISYPVRWAFMAGRVREAIAMTEAIAEVRATVTEGGV